MRRGLGGGWKQKVINTVFVMRNYSFGIVRTTRAGLGLCLAAAVLLVGCEKPGNSDPAFHLNDEGIDPSTYTPLGSDDPLKVEKIEKREYLASALEAMFGTPDQPFVFRETGLDLKKIWRASGPAGGMRPDAVAKNRDALQTSRTAKKAALTELENKATEEAAKAIKPEADLKAAQAQLAEAEKAKNTEAADTAKKQIAALKLQLKPKAVADEAVAAAKGEIEDLSMVLDSSIVQQGLYRQHCVHCHGVTGDGAGPTALFLFPYPRDYRQGIFKFKSTKRAEKPTHADLHRILTDGIPDTAMPSFRLLKPDELEALVEYVKYLSIRGQAETLLRTEALKEDKLPEMSRSFLVSTALQITVDAWNDAANAVVEPRGALTAASPRESLDPKMTPEQWHEAGKSLFLGEKTKCYTCHGTTGLGDGRNNKPFYDDWNKQKAVDFANYDAAVASGNKDAITKALAIKNSWLLTLQQQYPRNFRLNRFRFGRRPLDVYRRLSEGIAGTEMQGFAGTLTDTELWQLVDFVMALPYEPLGLPPGYKVPGTDSHGDGHGHATSAPAAPHGEAKPAEAAKPNEQASSGAAKPVGGE
jgi:mono/diheme cytochrome c family protein